MRKKRRASASSYRSVVEHAIMGAVRSRKVRGWITSSSEKGQEREMEGFVH